AGARSAVGRDATAGPVALRLAGRLGVVHPSGPPSVLVTLGRRYFAAGEPVAVYPIALFGLMTLTAAALVPDADALNVNSPSARHPGDAAWPQSVVPATPFT